MQVLSFELFAWLIDWLIDEKNRPFFTIENYQMAYEYHINQLLIRQGTGATYLVSSGCFEMDTFQLSGSL